MELVAIWADIMNHNGSISEILFSNCKGGATIAMTNFVGLSTSLIVKHGVFDCTPEVISGPETTSACWLLSCTGPATSSASSPSTNILPALQITNQTLLLF